MGLPDAEDHREYWPFSQSGESNIFRTLSRSKPVDEKRDEDLDPDRMAPIFAGNPEAMNCQSMCDFWIKQRWEDNDVTVKVNRAFTAVQIVFLLMLPQISATSGRDRISNSLEGVVVNYPAIPSSMPQVDAGTSGSGNPKDSDPGSKNSDSYVDFDRQRLRDLFASSESAGPGVNWVAAKSRLVDANVRVLALGAVSCRHSKLSEAFNNQ